MISFACPACRAPNETADSLGGMSAVCRSCGAFVTVPFPTPAEAVVESRCSKCQAVINPDLGVCGFCYQTVGRPEAAAAAKPRRTKRGVLAVALGAWAVGVLVIGLLFLVEAEAEGVPPATVCHGHLELLHAAALRCETPEGGLPKSKGGAFWKDVGAREGEESALACPLGAAAHPVYRGPAGAWEKIADDGIVACDSEGNHTDGITVLFKNGRIEFAPSGSDLYKRALQETSE